MKRTFRFIFLLILLSIWAIGCQNANAPNTADTLTKRTTYNQGFNLKSDAESTTYCVTNYTNWDGHASPSPYQSCLTCYYPNKLIVPEESTGRMAYCKSCEDDPSTPQDECNPPPPEPSCEDFYNSPSFKILGNTSDIPSICLPINVEPCVGITKNADNNIDKGGSKGYDNFGHYIGLLVYDFDVKGPDITFVLRINNPNTRADVNYYGKGDIKTNPTNGKLYLVEGEEISLNRLKNQISITVNGNTNNLARIDGNNISKDEGIKLYNYVNVDGRDLAYYRGISNNNVEKSILDGLIKYKRGAISPIKKDGSIMENIVLSDFDGNVRYQVISAKLNSIYNGMQDGSTKDLTIKIIADKTNPNSQNTEINYTLTKKSKEKGHWNVMCKN